MMANLRAHCEWPPAGCESPLHRMCRRRITILSLCAWSTGCGGRVSSPAVNGEWIPDSAAAVVDVADAGAGTLELDSGPTRPLPSDSPNPSVLLSACTPFAAIWGRTACQACINDSNNSCHAIWQQLSVNCDPQYSCGYDHCLCTSPCATSELCTCVAGCVPPDQSNQCTRLWTEAMQCVASFCAKHC
jgi:hypothetical protein